MELSTLNEEELLSEKLQKVFVEYCETDGNEESREALLQFLQNNDCREIISKCVDGDFVSDAFVWAGYRDPDILQTFLDQGMNVDVKDRNGNTALMWASTGGHKQIVQLLLNHNADIDLKNRFAESALDLTDDEEIKEMIQNHVNTSYVLK